MFYDRLLKLCEERGITPLQVRKELNISQSTMASWKSRGLTPNAATISKLADYFGVTVAFLLTGIDSQKNIEEADRAVAETERYIQQKREETDREVEAILGPKGYQGTINLEGATEEEIQQAGEKLSQIIKGETGVFKTVHELLDTMASLSEDDREEIETLIKMKADRNKKAHNDE